MSTTAAEPEIYDFGLNSKPDLKRPNWCKSLVRIGDREITVSSVVASRLLDIIARLSPKNQEDWKAIYWMICWGEPPSEVSRVNIKIQGNMAYMWGEPKNGVQP